MDFVCWRGKSSTAMGEAKGLKELHLITYDSPQTVLCEVDKSISVSLMFDTRMVFLHNLLSGLPLERLERRPCFSAWGFSV